MFNIFAYYKEDGVAKRTLEVANIESQEMAIAEMDFMEVRLNHSHMGATRVSRTTPLCTTCFSMSRGKVLLIAEYKEA